VFCQTSRWNQIITFFQDPIKVLTIILKSSVKDQARPKLSISISIDTTMFITETAYIKVEWKTGYLAHS